MLECIFTVDYELHGDGRGDLLTSVLEPMDRLAAVFERHSAKLVVFFEALEFEQIERQGVDPRIAAVRRQIQKLHRAGHEIGLHIHPQWANARFSSGRWHLDGSEYSLCGLSAPRIASIVDRAIAYTREIVPDPLFRPISFRAGAWLFQPATELASILYSRGIRIDSSVFKGGLHKRRKLDYRPALHNPRCWKFADDVNEPESNGVLVEFPIHTRMVAPWRLLARKRLQPLDTAGPMGWNVLRRWRDLWRFRQPMKFDLNRMSLKDMRQTLLDAIAEDRGRVRSLWPIVAIAHTKNAFDFQAVDEFLSLLSKKRIPISTLESVAGRWGFVAPALEYSACA